MKNYFKDHILIKLLSVFRSTLKLKQNEQLLVNNGNNIVDFNLKYVKIGDEFKYFRTPKN